MFLKLQQLIDSIDFNKNVKVEDVIKSKLKDLDTLRLSISNKNIDLNILNKQLKIEIFGENNQTKLIYFI